MPRKGQIKIPKRFCVNCNKELWKYTKIVKNKFNIVLCQKCWRELTKQRWFCIDCRKLVNRRVKRCPECAKKFRYEHIKRLGYCAKTVATREKMSKGMQGNKNCVGRKDSPETITKKKKVWTKEKRKQWSKHQKQLVNDEWIKKVSSFGEKNPMWRGGISNKGYKNFNKLLKKKIIERDNCKCQLCGIGNEECKKKIKHNLGIHHIDYNKENSNPENLITLCNKCNSKINYRREKWTNFFQEKIVNNYY